jgi:hypothetical protein
VSKGFSLALLLPLIKEEKFSQLPP